MGGGVPFCMLSTYQPASLCSSPFLLPFLLPSCRIFGQNGQKWAKVRFYLVWLGVFSGFLETRKGKNLRYFLNVGVMRVQNVGCLSAFFRAHWRERAGSWGLSSLWSCVPCLLSAFLLFPWCAPFEYAFICDFKAVYLGL